MKHLYLTLFAKALVAAAFLISAAHAEDEAGRTGAVSTAGVHGFDFEFGDWRVHHRVKRAGAQQWLEFDGTCTVRSIMEGAGNVEDHRFNKPDGVTHGVALRAYDAKTDRWAIWWVDGRNPHGPLDPPTVGRFENGVGTFYWDGVVNGQQIRTRFIWSQITRVSAHWEQANSTDGGKSWEVNWSMDFRRVQP
jgi:hypothetical protein